MPWKKLVILEKDLDSQWRRYIHVYPPHNDRHRSGFSASHPASEYLLFIIVGPVELTILRIFPRQKMYVSEEYVRAVRGGIGYTKAAGNYAASLYASRIATNMGYTQVMWLDAVERNMWKKWAQQYFLFNRRWIDYTAPGRINFYPVSPAILLSN